MKDKELLKLLENYIIKLDSGELNGYIWNNDICLEDLRRVALVLSKADFWDYVDVNNAVDIINNIDNIDFLNDENNLFWGQIIHEYK